MYIKEGDRVKVLYNPAIEGIEKPSWINKTGVVKWTDGYLYMVMLDGTDEVIKVYWNDMQLVNNDVIETVKISKEKRDLLYTFLTTKNKDVYEKLGIYKLD